MDLRKLLIKCFVITTIHHGQFQLHCNSIKFKAILKFFFVFVFSVLFLFCFEFYVRFFCVGNLYSLNKMKQKIPNCGLNLLYDTIIKVGLLLTKGYAHYLLIILALEAVEPNKLWSAGWYRRFIVVSVYSIQLHVITLAS
jgi:hypothetical protein